MESKIYLKIGFALFLFFAAIPIASQTVAEFDQPWLDQNKAIVIDAFHKNSIDWGQMKTFWRLRIQTSIYRGFYLIIRKTK